MAINRPNAAIRMQVRQRAGNICEYCLALADFSFHPFPVEHIIPLSKGGSNDFDNLALACQFCNNSKYDKSAATDPLTGAVVPLFHPRQHAWAEHFIWDENRTFIIGKTPLAGRPFHALK